MAINLGILDPILFLNLIIITMYHINISNYSYTACDYIFTYTSRTDASVNSKDISIFLI
jgi:hypothetical protein